MHKRYHLLLTVLGLVLACATALAQVTGASLRGFVTDGEKAPLSGVTVTAVHGPTVTRYVAVSNEKGRFVLDGLRPGGPYQVDVFLLGKVSVAYEGVTLTLGEASEMEVVMQPMVELGEVVVPGEAPVAPGAAGGGLVMDRGMLESVPVFTRSLDEVLVFAPQVTPGAYGLSILAANPLYNAIRVDGAPTGDPFFMQGSASVSLDQIEAIRVTTTPFDVRESGFTGGTVDILTKSGTNRIGGSAYMHMSGPSGAEVSYRTFGFTAGAPVVKDKLFVFAGGEYGGGVLDGMSEHRTHAHARVDWNISDAHSLMARVQYADSQLSDAFQFVSRLDSRLGERVSNELLAGGMLAPGWRNDWSLTDNLSLLAGSHRFTFGTQDELWGPVLNLSAYAQDEWAASPRFMLDFGVRADAPVKLGSGALAKIRPSLSPRLGFRLYTDRERRAFLRGGAGLFAGRLPFAWLHFPGSESVSQPRVARANLGYEQHFRGDWTITLDAVASKTLSDVFFDGSVLAGTDRGYAYSGAIQLQKHFRWGLDLLLSYAINRSFSSFDGHYPRLEDCVKSHLAVDPLDKDELSMSALDRPQHLSFLASYVSPRYGICRTRLSVAVQGLSGQHYSYSQDDSVLDFNGDAYAGNSLLYIPTEAELVGMTWTDPASAARFENFIRTDEYLSSHRGEWTRRNAGATPFEARVDVKLAQDFYFDRRHGRHVELVADLINAGNLCSPEFGAAYLLWQRNCGVPGAVNVLRPDSLAGDGRYAYSFSEDALSGLKKDPLRSSWRCSLGVRVCF